MVRPFLFMLPKSLSQSLLIDWLPLESIATLDSAFCNSEHRPHFNELAADPSSVYRVTTLAQQSPGFVRWCLLRRYQVDGVSIFNDLVFDDQFRADFLAAQGAGLRWVGISDDPNRDYRHVLLDVAKWCTNLVSVEFCPSQYFSDLPPWDEHLLALTTSCPNLEVLSLSFLNWTTSGLREALKHCKKLKRLLILVYQGDAELPVEVAIPTLTYLNIKNNVIPDEVLFAIGERCPELKTLYAFETSPGRKNLFSDAAVRAVLQGCPQLRETDVEHAASIGRELRVERAATTANCTSKTGRARTTSWCRGCSACLQT